MEIREKRVAEEIVGYTCDICGLACFKVDGPMHMDSSEYATLWAE